MQFNEIIFYFNKRLMQDFPVLDENARVAIMANTAYECMNFTRLQEIKPTVPGSRGGYGWEQWTGPRRVEFEKFCRARALDISSPDANYSFLAYELRTTEHHAITALADDNTLERKVEIFMRVFLRPGVPALDARTKKAYEILHVITNTVPPAKPQSQPMPEVIATTKPSAAVWVVMAVVLVILALAMIAQLL